MYADEDVAARREETEKIKELNGMMSLSSCALVSKTENKPLCFSGAGDFDHGSRGLAIRERDLWLGKSTTDINRVRWPTCWWWDVLQRTTDAAITRSHRHQVLAILGLRYWRRISYMLYYAKGVEVHRAVALRHVRVTRI